MRERKPQLIITFMSTADAIKMERFCEERLLPGRMIPVPASVSAGCGLAWKTEPEQKDTILKALVGAKIRWEQMRIILL